MKCGLTVGLLSLALWGASQPEVGEIVRKSVANTIEDWRAAPTYDFTERDVIENGHGTKTSRVLMIDGSPYYKLIERDNEPLDNQQAAEEERKLRRETARRQHETPAQRSARIAQYDKERRQDNALLREMGNAFDFRSVGEETINGRSCYVLASTPKPGYQPTSRDTRVLTGMRGKMWVDKSEFRWVRVEAELFRPVAFGLFIAHVEPPTQFTLEQQPVAGNLWLPSHFSMHVKARVLGFWAHDSNADETYWDYRPASQVRLPRAAAE